MLRRRIAVCCAVALLWSPVAGATGFGFTIQVFDPGDHLLGSVESGSLPISAEDDTKAGTTTYTLTAPYYGNGWSLDSWTSTANLDPFVFNNFVVHNNMGVTQTYVVGVLQPIPAQNVNQFVASSITASVLDSDGNAGSVAASVGQSGVIPIYQGQVNGATQLNLLPPVTVGALPVTCNANGCFATSAAGPVSGPLGPILANSIGILLTFTLTPGDSASVLSRFEVVPEPASAALLGLGLLAVALFRRSAHR